MHLDFHPHQTMEYPMQTPNAEVVLSRLYELCPEVKQLGIQPIVLNKGNRL
jgi:hypothetical protein